MATSAELIRLDAIVSPDPDIQDAVVITKGDVINLVDTRVDELNDRIDDVEALVAFPNAYGVAYGVVSVGAALDTLNTLTASHTASITALNASVTTNTADIATNAASIAAINAGSATFYLARANHTGTQTASTISDFNSTTQSIITGDKNVSNGIAGLDVNARLLEAQCSDVLLRTSFRSEGELTDHFFGPVTATGTKAGDLGWSVVEAGGGDVQSLSFAPDQQHWGILGLDNVNAAGQAAITLATNAVQFGMASWTQEFLIYVPALSTLAQEYILQLGFGDTTAGDQVDGFYFDYDRLSLGADRWRVCAANNSVRVKTDSTVSVVAGWNRLSMACDNTTVSFVINGTSTPTILQNQGPTAVNRYCGPIVSHRKTAGANSIIIGVDLFHMAWRYTTPPSP